MKFRGPRPAELMRIGNGAAEITSPRRKTGVIAPPFPCELPRDGVRIAPVGAEGRMPVDFRLPIESARRWLALAERRRAYFVELHRSGRWPRYYSEEAFKAHLRDVMKDVERWTKVIANWDGTDRNKTAA